MGISLARGTALVTALLASTISFAATPGKALDLATPEGGSEAFRRVQCSSVDKQPVPLRSHPPHHGDGARVGRTER